MKICPTCRRTYDDDALNFCLDDGSMLNFTADTSTAPTIAMHQPRPTSPASPYVGQPDWGPSPATPHTMLPPKKRSKAWLWAFGILALGVLFCGGGVAGFFFYVASVANNANLARTNSTSNTRSDSWTNTNSDSPPVDPERVQEVELQKWVKATSSYGTTEYSDGELQIAANEEGYYYVIVSPDDYQTDGATTRVTVRNPAGASSSLGYGLIVHSETTPLEKDYAFLIDSERKRFRVARHDAERESSVTPWTSSKNINAGTAENVLEVRDKGAKIEFYVNGQLATSVTNKQGPTGGVPGLYAGDGVKIGFKKLEIIK